MHTILGNSVTPKNSRVIFKSLKLGAGWYSITSIKTNITTVNPLNTPSLSYLDEIKYLINSTQYNVIILGITIVVTFLKLKVTALVENPSFNPVKKYKAISIIANNDIVKINDFLL